MMAIAHLCAAEMKHCQYIEHAKKAWRLEIIHDENCPTQLPFIDRLRGPIELLAWCN